MPVDYAAEARTWTRRKVVAIWNKIVQGKAIPQWPPGKPFEHVILRAFELEGARVVWPYRTKIGDEVVEEIDGAVYLSHISALIEAKDTKTPKNVEVIAKLRSQLARRPAGAIGVVFSRRGFTSPAVQLSTYLAPQTVLLWDGEEIGLAIQKRKMVEGLSLKYQHAIEHAFPNFNLKASWQT